MDGLSLTIGRVRGVPIKAHFSLLLIFVAFVSPVISVRSPERFGFSRQQLVGWAILTAVVFVLTILLHELGHVFAARREGMEVHGVTLWALGGLAMLSGGTPSPGRDFRVAAAGPAVTALLAAGLTLVARLTPEATGLGAGGPVLAIVDIVGRAQVFLLAFNLIPAYPLDGGRIFLAGLWRLRNNLTSASKTASAVGKGFGAVLIALGVLGLASRQLMALLPAAFQINSLTALVLGYFIFSANRSPMALVPPAGRGRPGGDGLVVADFMNRDFVVAGPDMTIRALLEALRKVQVRPTALVIEDGRPLGMITRQRAEQVPEIDRDTKTIADVMVAKDELRTVDAMDPLSSARRVLEDGPETAVVLNDDVVVGLVSVSDVAHAMVLGDR